MIYTEAQTLLRYNLGQREYCLPESIIYIGDGAFQNNKDLVSLILHDNVQTIGDYAMRNCRSLSSVTLPSAVTSFGIGVFTNCAKITSVCMPSGVIAIDHLTFRGCTKLRDVVIPDTVQGISPRAFETCKQLDSVIIPPGKISLLPEKAALIAARTFMHMNPGKSDAYINSFVTAQSEPVIRDCLRHYDRSAFWYMIQNDLFTNVSINETIELSRQMNCTDICAMLLSYQNQHAFAEDTAFLYREL